LRYRLDSVAQTQAHLRDGAGGALLFYPDGVGRLLADAQVLLELAFADTEQTRLLRGRVHATLPERGSWLALEQPGGVRAEVESGVLSRRHHRRFGADLPCELLAGDSAFAASLQDLSLVGARLRGEGFSCKPGARVQLRIAAESLPARIGPGTVIWSNKAGAGLHFDRDDAACRISVGTLYASLQGAWSGAPLAHHPRGCCQNGLLLDPPLPG
jgi:hypothetical protein